MESGTLDFDDLMDTGDEFSGFEITKFTPVNDNDGEGDGILRTPEHEPDNEDYQIKEDKTNMIKEKMNEDNDPAVNGNEVDDFSVKESKKMLFTEKMFEVPDKDYEINNQDHLHALIENGLDNDHKEKEVRQFNLLPEDTYRSNETLDTGQSQEKPECTESKPNYTVPPPKKKKFVPTPRPRQKLWTGSKTETSEPMTKAVLGNDVSSKQASDTDEVKETKVETETDSQGERAKSDNDIEDGEREVNVEEEDPHQQSFLSFLSLKPGMSKPLENDQKAKDEELEHEFYSRKRLRTRKKVSYVEDVPEDDDDEFQIGEEEMEEEENDYMLDIGTSRRRSRSSNRSSRKSAPFSAAAYVKSLQNIAPNPQIIPAFQNVIKTSLSNATKIDSDNLIASAKGGPLKGLFECGLCGTFFSSASLFVSHQELVHSDEKKVGKSGMETFRCDICGFVLTNRFAFLEHKRMKHSKNPNNFNCNRCRVSFPFLVDLQKHQLTCVTPMCTTCGAKFNTWNEIADHKAKFHSAVARQWLSCVMKSCGFRCVTQAEMNQHIKQKHLINELFSCNAPLCSKIFSTREQLNEHKKESHASEFIVQYQCMECKQCYSSKTLLAEHQYLHTMDKLRKCDLCGRQFSSAWEVKKHKEVHVTKGTVKCGTCARWCSDTGMLNTHLCEIRKKPVGPRVYFCDVCHQDFRSDIKMFEHRKEHKNYYQCESCFWECKTDVEYFEHREVHGKFTCKECCEELATAKDLETHLKAHRYYVKTEDMEDNGKQEKVMYLCPNLLNVVKA